MVLVGEAAKSLSFFLFLYYVCLLSSSSSSSVAATLDHDGAGGFSVELIHRDSPKSPLYDPSETHSQRVTKALRRSIDRAATRFSSRTRATDSAQSTVFTNGGEYLMILSVGTPPFPILAIADTGSDITWTQCQPCEECYNQTEPIFNPSASKTYKTTPCSSPICKSVTGAKTFCSSSSSSSNHTLCEFKVMYADLSVSKGDIATDTITLSSASFPTIVLGCSHENSGVFSDKDGGLVGLGHGAGSLVSQISSSIGGKFSYCLVPAYNPDSDTKNSSKLNFGSKAVISGHGVVSTPLLSGSFGDTFYYLGLEGISVSGLNNSNTNKFINFKASGSAKSSDDETKGNIIIDSGTTLTMVPERFYPELESAVDQELTMHHAKRVDDPTGYFGLCYESDEKKSSDFHAPIITMHFKGGADVKLSGINTFLRVSGQVVCFAIIPSKAQDLSIYGNVAQMNFLVGYDGQKNTLSFKQTDCTTYNQ